MSHNGSSEHQPWGLAGWIIKSLVSAGILYLLAFVVLTLFPQIGKAAARVGLSENVLETIFYPILKLIGR